MCVSKTAKGRSEHSIRHGTIFEDSKLSMRSFTILIYLWVHEELTMERARREVGVSAKTAVSYRQMMRDVCVEYLVNNPVMVGGVGHEVQIDETAYTRRKYNRGRLVPHFHSGQRNSSNRLKRGP